MLARLASISMLLLATFPALAQEKADKIVADTWNAAYLSGHHAGWVHNVTREVERNGQKVLRTQSEFELQVGRESGNIRINQKSGTEETLEGKVTGVFMRQMQSQNQELVVTGDVQGGELITRHDHGDGKVMTKKSPWNEAAIGLYGQERIFAKRAVKPGDQFDYLSFEPAIISFLSMHAKVKAPETVKTLSGPANLLRVELSSDKIFAGAEPIQFPPMTVWLDKNYDIIRSDMTLDPFGAISFFRTTKTIATNLPKGAPKVNIGLNSLIPLNWAIQQPYDAEQATYRFTVRGDEHPETAFARDDRQSIKKSDDGKSYELTVRVVPPANLGENAPRPGKEFLESNYFITSADPEVRRHAEQAVGPTTDPWHKALNIEKYVHDAIKNKNYEEAFATASEVARTLKGDCTEHAVLAAAMCRAVGVPSRTAVGLLYVNHPMKGAVMGFHMWAEVWIDGQWRPIDAVLGRGYVGATHLKISDHSWHDVQSLTPLLPVYRVLGKLDMRVERVQGRAR